MVYLCTHSLKRGNFKHYSFTTYWEDTIRENVTKEYAICQPIECPRGQYPLSRRDSDTRDKKMLYVVECISVKVQNMI